MIIYKEDGGVGPNITGLQRGLKRAKNDYVICKQPLQDYK